MLHLENKTKGETFLVPQHMAEIDFQYVSERVKNITPFKHFGIVAIIQTAKLREIINPDLKGTGNTRFILVKANYSDDVSTSYIDLIPDSNSTPPDENLMKESLRIDLLTALQRLPKNYPEIMISLYGIYCEKKSIVTLSKEYGLCEERIKQINKHCLKLLKENELNKDLKNYL